MQYKALQHSVSGENALSNRAGETSNRCTSTVVWNEPNISLPVIQNMSRYLFSSFLESSSYETVCSLVNQGGYLAGEDFTYNFLDLQSSPDCFYENMVSTFEEKGMHVGHTIQADKAYDHIEIVFEPVTGCRSGARKEVALQCEFMKGFLLGIMETYTGCPCQVQTRCKQGHSVSGHCRFTVFMPKGQP